MIEPRASEIGTSVCRHRCESFGPTLTAIGAVLIDSAFGAARFKTLMNSSRSLPPKTFVGKTDDVVCAE